MSEVENQLILKIENELKVGEDILQLKKKIQIENDIHNVITSYSIHYTKLYDLLHVKALYYPTITPHLNSAN